MFDAINKTPNAAKPDSNDQASRFSVERVAEAKLPTDLSEFRLIGYRSLISDEEFVVLAQGELTSNKPTLARIHSQCLTGDVFDSTRCDCVQQLRSAMKLISEEMGHLINLSEEIYERSTKPGLQTI